MYFKEFLRVNHLLLISNLRISNNFMNNLSNERIINRIMIESIENQKNNNLKINYLLKVVAYRDKNLIPFLKILQKFGEINILSKLNTSNLPVNVKDSVSVLLKNVTDQENYCLKNTNHVVKNLSVYRMKSVPRGNAIIINNIDFSKSYNNLSNRDGSLKDVDDLVDIFTKLLFIAKVYTNLNVKEMLDTFNSEAKKLEHKNRDCFVLIILSHGFKNHVFGVLGQSLLISKITNIFNGLNCPYLIGKPKIFIIQACQGDKITHGVINNIECVDSANVIMDTRQNQCFVENEHKMCHMLLATSSVPNYASWRLSTEGTWFIQSLVNCLTKYAYNHHFLDILTLVRKEVSLRKTVNNNIQLTQTIETLDKKLFLFPEYID